MTIECAVEAPLGRFRLDVRFASSHAITGIFGPSGAGKSSLLECVIGIRRDARGRIRVGERVWLDSERGIALPPERRNVGYVPQAGLLFPHLTAWENLLTGRDRAVRAGADFDRVLASAIDVLEIRAVLDQPSVSLSGGERQRVALARALASAPSLLVLDEPLASLDVGLRHRLLPFLRRIRDEFAIPMLLVSHSPLEVQALCDHVIALREGTIVKEGRPVDVLASMHLGLGEVGETLRSVFVVTVDEASEGRARVVLAGTDVGLVVRGRAAPGSGERLVSVAADAVMLATERPSGISATNVLPGVVARVDRGPTSAFVHVRIADGAPPLLAELAPHSIERLGLDVGREVHAVVKASSCELLEAEA